MIQALDDDNAVSAGIAGAALTASLVDQLQRKGLISELDVSEILIFARLQLILAMPSQLQEALTILDGMREPSRFVDENASPHRARALPSP